MSLSPNVCEDSPEQEISKVCRNLETQFMEDLSKAEGLRVFARVRPMLNSEIEAGNKECIMTIDDQTLRAVVPSSSVKYKNSSLSQDIIEDFKFTAAYGPEVGQFVFFEESMMNTMQNFIEGQNSLVFSYGITGSGKTFTLQGDANYPGIIPLSLHLFFASIENRLLDRIVLKPDKFADVRILNNNEIKEEYQVIDQLLSANNQEEWNFRNSSKKSLAMILCETFSDKFESEEVQTTLGPEEMAQAQAAAVMKEMGKKSAEQQSGYCSVWVSFVEIYNEYIYDLLQPNVNQRTKLTLGEDKNGDVYVKGLREVCVFNSCEALKLLSFGQRNLKIASTKLNYQSSRSHCIFTIKVVRIPDPENITYAKVSRLSFCDLAGSERASKSQTTGLRLKEAGCINTSLLVLGRCLEQLRLNPSLRDKKRIPFRESKLTRLLSGFFTGRGKAVMITNASPSEVTFDETLHALRFSALATELIINDSYIATAANTLQTITNMWTNARENVSTISDRSISFEDSNLEALQEKDELIEKLLDLADSLTKNLEKEKKEKAELEIKIRRDVCQEYSEYSDELLERQKKNYEEEQDAIREIYKKRISSMEKMYENIIKDLKLQMEESDSSCEEDTASANPDAVNGERKSTVFGKLFVADTQEDIEEKENDYKNNFVTETEGFLRDMETLKDDLQTISEELKRTKVELEKSKNYCIALESASEEMEKKVEISNANLEKALMENGELKIRIDYLQASYEDALRLKKEIDNESNSVSDCGTLKEQFEDIKLQLENALKINEDLNEEIDALKNDCVSYKDDNNDLFEKKTAMEGQLKSLSEEFASTKCEKEDLYQKLKESERNVVALNKETNTLFERTNELIKFQKESKAEYEKSLEEVKQRAIDAEEVLKSVNQTLENALAFSEEQKKKLVGFETECANLREENANILKIKEDLEVKYAFATEELEFEKNKVKSESTELEKTSQEIEKLTKELDTMKSECNQYEEKLFTLQETNCNLEEKLSSLLKELESEKTLYEQERGIVNCKLNEALSTIEKGKIEVEKLLKSNNSYQEEISELQISNKELLDKLSFQASKTESEVSTYKGELDAVNGKLTSALSALDKQKQEVENLTNVINSQKNETAELQKQNEELLNSMKSQTESEVSTYKGELDAVNSKLASALSALDKQKQDVENLTNVISSQKNEIAKLQKQNEELLNSMKSQTESEVSTYKGELDAVNGKLTSALSALDKQKQEVENLTNVINSQKNETAELQKQNEELLNSMKSQTESEVSTYKGELDAVNSKLASALSARDKQKQEVENLTNVISSQKNEIAELQKQNGELLNNMKSQTETVTMDYKEELDAVNSKLNEALSALEKQKQESENLKNVIDCDKKEITVLQKQNKELQDNTNSQADLLDSKKELDAVNNKLDEALSALDEQKQEVENLTNIINSQKNEIAELQKQNEELLNNMKSQTESVTMDYKEEFDAVNSKLNEALLALEKQKQETENLKNVIDCDKKEITVLQKQNKELQDNMNSQAEMLDYKKELDAVNSKLDEALSALDKQKHEVETLTNVINSDKNEIAELQKLNKELQDTINSETESKNIALKQELDTVNSRLEEALSTIKDQKEESLSMLNECNSLKSKIADILKIDEELKEKINSQDTQTDILYELVNVLEKKELWATRKIDMVQLDFDKYKEENENLKEQLAKESDNQENECNILHKLIQILQQCEKYASNKMKELHTSSIKHVEQIMDLEKCIKQRDASIEGLKNEYNLLQKQFKDFQTTSKKQLQTEKQQYMSEIGDIKTEKTVIEKQNESLKKEVTQLEAVKGRLETEVKSMKSQFEKEIERKNQLVAEREKLAAEVKITKTKIEEKKEAPNTIEEPKTVAKKSRNSKEKTDEKSSQKPKEKKENEPPAKEEGKSDKKSSERRAQRKAKKESEVVEEMSEKKSSKNVKNQSEKRKTKSSEKSEVLSENKKSKTVIYEETDENSNSETTEKIRGSSRRQLRSVENVSAGLSLISNKDLSSTKNKGSKRKGPQESFDDKLHEKKILKKIKLQDINEIENISNIKRPQNLRIELLKANTATNDISVPSPKMTRARKRLCNLNAKDNMSRNTSSPRTVRS